MSTLAINVHGFDVACPVGMDEAKFAEIMNEDMSYVHAHMQDEGQDVSRLKKVEVEWKKYLVALFMNRGENLAITRPVDAFAHTHLMFTKPFRSFCERVFGVQMDHFPTNSQAERNALAKNGKRTVSVLHSLFGKENVPTEVWNDEVVCIWDCNNVVPKD